MINYFEKSSEILDGLYGATKHKRDMTSNENMKRLIEIFGVDLSKLNVIHVAGTVGKGSFCIILDNILREANLKTGIFVGPSIEGMNDRIRINGDFIPPEKFYHYLKTIVDKINELEINCIYFEIVTLIALMYFADEGVDFAIFEVGVGGLYDSTNCFLQKSADVIMKIDYDHQNVLGNTLEEIAFNKAGIIMPFDTVYVYPQGDNVIDVIKDEAKKVDAKVKVLDDKSLRIGKTGTETEFSYDGEDYSVSLAGEFQAKNAAMAVWVAKDLNDRFRLDISDEAIKKGLSEVKWPCRIETVKKDPYIIIDGAHNEASAAELKKYLLGLNKKVIMITSFLKDKDYRKVFETFEGLNAEFIVTSLVFKGRDFEFEKLEEAIGDKDGIYFIKDNKEAYKKALELYTEDALIVVAGSLYLASVFRDLILGLKHYN
ncbi:bifunctional folylpolyglutamate synthase/dihydrofolate synthase [Fenollaria massiliensis]|uniref:tetrahydrofolate synthase n=1 Tax=Fenollaria massiliensis TaxID=938288 RepID=A0A9E7IXB2_9FIRM|nr:Mur ligase family protein [Fenollaria massiliensis]UQK59261.1 Mur ligase family protein [Fenollaria massiliensis]